MLSYIFYFQFVSNKFLGRLYYIGSVYFANWSLFSRSTFVNTVTCITTKVLPFSGSIESVTAVAGNTAELPCRVNKFTLGEKDDRAKLVMWFRNGSETPFYT